ncbi:protein tyrosine phosphatase [Acerihabitans sp. TG2]|uniref:arsenate reductase/protein-tyrosine-phosphatase family protein n=1 Tax=Acerihabitans sp. TG2 TaxID=3096008 RepID=UPI002B22EBFC|nr:protein tyrosine phosphatase [Acerihabitans sp. TG2]MEA9389283.1 protein tyrosine phosphatase [Acerihabitans sp. TG2]
MFNSILVVCMGNICRSPIGEGLLKRALPTKNISSAGLSALIGQHADKMTIELAKNDNLNLDFHIARQITPAMCRENDLILVMEKKHVDMITRIAPEVRGKTMLFGYWINIEEIADPYRRSRESFELVYRLLDESTRAWVKALSR